MEKDFDETIIDNEEEFNKHFKKIELKDRPNHAINKALREKSTDTKSNQTADDIIEKLLQDKTALSRLKAELETV